MKKILAMILASVLALSAFSACADDKKTESTAANDESKTENQKNDNSSKGGVNITVPDKDESKTESEKEDDESKGNTSITVPDKTDDSLVGVWTGGDSTAIATYIFEAGGSGNFVSYVGEEKTVSTITWGVNGNKLAINYGGGAFFVEYEYALKDGALDLSANGSMITYKNGVHDVELEDAPYDVDPEIVGVWYCDITNVTYTLNEDGSGKMLMESGKNATVLDMKWYVDGDSLFFSLRKMGVELELEKYTYMMHEGGLAIINDKNQANVYERVEDTPEESSEEESGAVIDYPKNGGDDNLAGYWYGEGFDMEIEADGTGRRIYEGTASDAFWGIKEGQFYFTFISVDGASFTDIYDYIVDAGKLYVTDPDGIETVFSSTPLE